MDTLNQIDISIIIPIYNVEKYLTVCIDSLKNQGGLRMEIILVNDGSTDLSGEIADEYAKKEERIKVIHQENGGAVPEPGAHCHISPAAGRIQRKNSATFPPD